VFNVTFGALSRLLVDVFALGDVLEQNLGDDGLLGAGASVGTCSVRLAQGLESVTPVAREVRPVFQGVPRAFFVFFILDSLALDNAPEKVGWNNAANVGSHFEPSCGFSETMGCGLYVIQMFAWSFLVS
jgi:hypothetical protein